MVCRLAMTERPALLAVTGRVGWEPLRAAASLAPALALGIALSRRVHHRVDGLVLRRIVLGFAIASGVALLART